MRIPSSRLPASNDSRTRKTSATFTAAFPAITIVQTTSTVSSARDRKTTPNPSARSRQWPRESGSSDASSRAGIRSTSTAESAKVAAFTRYGTSGPYAARSTPPSSGPSSQVRLSVAWKSEFARARSARSTRFGIPA